jgi:hypothetical protein
MKRHRIEIEVEEYEGARFDQVRVKGRSVIYRAHLPSNMVEQWTGRAVRQILEIEQSK